MCSRFIESEISYLVFIFIWPFPRQEYCFLSVLNNYFLIRCCFNQIDQIEAEANEAIRKHLEVEVKVYQPGDPELDKVIFLES